MLKSGVSLWHIDKHGVLPTARQREREREEIENGPYLPRYGVVSYSVTVNDGMYVVWEP